MQLDGLLPVDDLAAIPALAAAAETAGLAGLWTTETQHDPFLPLALATTTTHRVELGTAVAIAFPRSPMVTAQVAWDLARLTNGRFRLGLGTQVRAHLERRFAVTWAPPAERLADYVDALRAIWRAWQNGTRLRHTGPYYRLSLMTPFFDPGPNRQPTVPLLLAGVNRRLCRLAGERADGLHIHPLHTRRYLAERVLPWLDEGLVAAGRSRGSLQVCASVLTILGATPAERAIARQAMRQQIAFYASTPAYRPIFDLHGWGEVAVALSSLAAHGRWSAMADLIDDAMLAACAVEATSLAEAAEAVSERVAGLVDRVAFYQPFRLEASLADWRAAVTIIARA